ncbi:unnamed protein product [Macrosiphum euphorbiae]|uniref:PWWP domain-containing protein n=1 Tax=Macrosiphum euphorbiae TaxID=13131 RepID=A0AAV0VYT8_9HEMI|nr:unnamed protein product [Macrosiphum euphorbiae]
MSEPKSNINPTYALGTLLWVKLLKRVWWPGTVIDPQDNTIPQELKDYVKKVEPISCVVKFKDDKYHVVEFDQEVYLYPCDRKIEFIEKGFSLYKNQLKGLPVIGNFKMEFFIEEVKSMEHLIGGDIHIFENLKKEKEKVKSIVKELFTPTNTKKSKKKEVEKKSLPAPKLPKTLKTPKTPKSPNQPKPKPVSKRRTSTQSKVGKTCKRTNTEYCCQSQDGCKFTTNRYDNLKWHIAGHKKRKDEVTTSKSSNSSTSNKRKNLKTKPSEVKKQKLQEELLKDWDNDGEDEDEEINTSGVQSSSDFAQSSNEEVLQTMIDVQSSGNAVQSPNEEVIPTSKVLQNKNDSIPIISKDISRNREVQGTITCSPNKVFDFNENDNNTPVVELRQSKSNCSSTVDNDISETFESTDFVNEAILEASPSESVLVEKSTDTPVVELRQNFVNEAILEASPSESVLVEKSAENVIDKPHGIQSNELANEIDNQTKSTELLLEKTDNTLDQINNFENSLSCISSSINTSDANILTEVDNVVIDESELSECGSLNKTTSLYKDTKIETNVVGIQLVENMSTETEDNATVKENTNDKEIVSNDEKVNQFYGTTIDENMPIENSCSVDSTSNKIDCEDKIMKEEFLDVIPDWLQDAEWKSTRSGAHKAFIVNPEGLMYIPDIHDIGADLLTTSEKLNKEIKFRSEIKDPNHTSEYIFGDEYYVYLPKSLIGSYSRMEELPPNVNPVTVALENLILEYD